MAFENNKLQNRVIISVADRTSDFEMATTWLDFRFPVESSARIPGGLAINRPEQL